MLEIMGGNPTERCSRRKWKICSSGADQDQRKIPSLWGILLLQLNGGGSLVAKLCPTLETPWMVATRLLSPWDFPGKNTGVGCHFLLWRIFSTQGLNPRLLHCRWILCRLNHQGSPFQLNNLTLILCSSQPKKVRYYMTFSNLATQGKILMDGYSFRQKSGLKCATHQMTVNVNRGITIYILR